MDRAAFYLRFQNVMESKEEDLRTIMAELIAQALQRDSQEILLEINEAYRIQTSYARHNRLPREVHVRFARKKVRDIIYKITRDEPLIYKDKEIQTLKHILKKVREQRRDYKFLATQLIKRNIMFGWLIPEGMLVSWQEKRIRIDNLDKAQDLYHQIVELEEESSSKDELETGSQEDQQQELGEIEQEGGSKEEIKQGEKEGIRLRTCPQRDIRINRR
uniref:L1 transposable element RRM domain-containing protein n=1 Tax=Micrurus surinamensis TaxID=129470 RepID=A0A2D4PDJ1_MICSU